MDILLALKKGEISTEQIYNAVRKYYVESNSVPEECKTVIDRQLREIFKIAREIPATTELIALRCKQR